MKMRRRNVLLQSLLMGASALLLRTGAATQPRKKICFVAGADSHAQGAHEFIKGCRLLAGLLNENVPAVHAIVYEGGWPEDPAFFDEASAIVIFSDGLEKHPAAWHFDQLQEQWEKGTGIACLHYAILPPQEKGGRFLDWMGGYYQLNWSVNPYWTADFKGFPDHPVTRGVQPFSIRDEWYFHMRFRENMEGVVPVLSAHPPAGVLKKKDGPHSGNPAVRAAVEAGEIQHVAWVSESDKGGRGFGFTGGHYHKNWQDDNFRKLVLNAIAWIANIEVPAEGIPSRTPAAEEFNRG